MRHLLSLLLGLVLAPLIYVAAGYSAIKLDAARPSGDLHLVPAIIGLLAALVAGGLFAILVMARLSPVGPVVAGLLYLGVTLWAVLDLAGFVNAVPRRTLGVDGLLRVPVGFGVILLAVPLLCTVFSPRRWRHSAQPAPGGYLAAPAYANPPADVAAPSYASSYGSPSYDDASAPASPRYDPSEYQPPAYQPSVYTPTSPSYESPTAPSYAAGASDFGAPAYASPNEPTITSPRRSDDPA